MREILFACLLTFIFSKTNAQLLSLNNQELIQLKTRIKNDHETKKQFLPLEKLAQKYLKDEPNPIDTIRSEGLLKGNPLKERTNQSLPDFNKMFVLALQYKITEDRAYLVKANNFLSAWAKINISRGDPIDDSKLDRALEAFDLVKDDIPLKDKSLIANWLTQTAMAEINSRFMVEGKSTAINNWNAHRIKIVGSIGFLLGNQEFIKWSVENLKKHIAINLYEDGTSLDFKQRDAMHYHIYDLEPMLKLIKIIKRAKGEDLYSYKAPTGSSVKKSVEWMLPYVNGKKQHEEYVNTTVKFDRARAKNNEPGFAPGSMFVPRMALPVFELAVYFDASLENTLKTIEPEEKTWKRIILNITQQK